MDEETASANLSVYLRNLEIASLAWLAVPEYWMKFAAAPGAVPCCER
jgi:hypothetical protein